MATLNFGDITSCKTFNFTDYMILNYAMEFVFLL